MSYIVIDKQILHMNLHAPQIIRIYIVLTSALISFSLFNFFCGILIMQGGKGYECCKIHPKI